MANELRRFSRDLRPSVLDDLGIAAALLVATIGLVCDNVLKAERASR